jgi:hypothetical protein
VDHGVGCRVERVKRGQGSGSSVAKGSGVRGWEGLGVRFECWRRVRGWGSGVVRRSILIYKDNQVVLHGHAIEKI